MATTRCRALQAPHRKCGAAYRDLDRKALTGLGKHGASRARRGMRGSAASRVAEKVWSETKETIVEQTTTPEGEVGEAVVQWA